VVECDVDQPPAYCFYHDGVQFFGVISALPFQRFQWREVDGKVGDPRLLFMDNFIIGLPGDDLIFAHGFE